MKLKQISLTSTIKTWSELTGISAGSEMTQVFETEVEPTKEQVYKTKEKLDITVLKMALAQKAITPEEYTQRRAYIKKLYAQILPDSGEKNEDS